MRYVDIGPWLAGEGLEPHVGNDAYDAPMRTAESQIDGEPGSLADGILGGEVLPDELFID